MAFVIGERPKLTTETTAAVNGFWGVTTGSLGHLTDFGFARGLQPLVRPAKAVGLAYTVRVPHLDGVAVHYALNHIAAGEVLVIDTSGQRNRAAWGGGHRLRRCESRGRRCRRRWTGDGLGRDH